jgi:UTP--glucose-1-phosphate uridylyltransferase
MKIRKAVIPAAGWGTRTLPASKAIPKEMFPVVDRPAIQYMVEEAVASGIEHIIMIISKGKSAIIDHFDFSYELEDLLQKKGKTQLLAEVQEVSRLAKITAIRQGNPLGLGHAVLCAKDVVGDEPFVVLLGDDMIDSDIPCTKQMMDIFEELKGPIVAVSQIPEDKIHLYGVADTTPLKERIYKIEELVEKPSKEAAPSNLGVIGRYVLVPQIFEVLEHLPFDEGGEIGLTEGLLQLSRLRPVYA